MRFTLMLSNLRRLILIVCTILILPALALLAVILLLANLLYCLKRLSRNSKIRDQTPLSGCASIVILNWNGKDLLAQGLPSVLEAVAADGREHEILVVDNGSSDGSVDFVKANFPSIQILALPENLGFVKGNNAGARAARHETIVLLNNDMVVDRGFLRPLLDGFGPETFAVTSQIYLQDISARREETGKTTASFRRGMIDYSHCDLAGRALRRNYYPALWAGGGSSAFHRRRFLELGGFSDIFSPMYVEDTDLSYRAWKSGYEILFAHASIVYHKHRASSARRFSPPALRSLIQRNQFVFIWKNIRDWRLLLSHCLFLPWTCYRLARDHGIGIWKGVAQAIARLPSITASILRAAPRESLSDREVFTLFDHPERYFYTRPRLEAKKDRGAGKKPHILWVTAYLPHLGRHAGAGRMYQILKRLSAAYRISLLTFLESDEEREFIGQLDGLCVRIEAMRRIRPPLLQLFPYEPFDEFRTPEMERAVRQTLEEEDIDLIQLEYTQMACYSGKPLGIPSLLTKHEVDFAACLRRAKVENRGLTKLRWFYNYLQVLDREIALLQRVDAAICMTEPDARELCKFGASVPVHVINTGVDLDFFTPMTARPASHRLVFVGAFQHSPNVDAMIHFCAHILPLIRSRVPDIELTIVGSNPTPPILGLAAIPGVHVTGFVPDVRPSMAESSVYIVPLRLGVGIRGKILEAWGMAMAVVATSVAAAGLRAEKGTDILIADDPEKFAAHVIELLVDPDLRARLGAAGRRVAEQYYGWEASVRALDELYRNYLGGQA